MRILTPPECRLYVEMGAEACAECTSRFLRDRGWRGLVLDGNHANPSINLRQELMDADNIGPLLQKYEAPHAFDHLTIDVDLNTWWVLQGADECKQISKQLQV